MNTIVLCQRHKKLGNRHKIRRMEVCTDRNVRTGIKLKNKLFKWAIRSDIIDLEYEGLGFNIISIKEFLKRIKPRLDNYITMTWDELEQRKSCHPMDVEKIQNEMFTRLEEKFGENIPETLYQVDVTSKYRIWGIKIDNVFCLMWKDPFHQVYPVQKKHT